MRTIKKYYMRMHIMVFKRLKEPLNLSLACLRYKPKMCQEDVENKQKMLNLEFSQEETFSLFRFLLEK